MKISLTHIEEIVPGHKVIYDNSSMTPSGGSIHSMNPSSTYTPKKTVDPNDGIYLVLDSKVVNNQHYSSYFLKCLVLYSKIEEVNAYVGKGWGGDSNILTVDIDDDEISLLQLNQ